ncbi:hypothetical protein [Candidatus Korobacter versatilis]|uniref:hypothetical protein n=1 Tax=Candidatus Korobacter versatilis TaxID=658062 RepID=UPI0011D05DFC|nr:hypothetical protein [Candidatus Koribacter versatilis]
MGKTNTIRWLVAAALIVGGVFTVNFYLDREVQTLARDMLAEHFHSEVALDTIHVRLLPTARVSGSGLVLSQTYGGAKIPFISAQKFSANASLWGMLSHTRQLHHVRVEGLIITVARHPQGEKQPTAKRKVPELDIDEVEADGAKLVILANKPGKRSLVYDMHHLVLTQVGKSNVMHYLANLRNALPPGEIEAEGSFGPWNFDDAGGTHLDGNYVFKKADLGVFKQISGTLSSTGSFTGELGRIDVKGSTETPDFAVKSGSHPVNLHTDFDATVDGTNGDTQLHSVRAKLLNSTFVVNGTIVDVPGPTGHIIYLHVVSDDAKVQDMLRVAVKTPPAMKGGLKFDAKVKINPGQGPVRNRITAEGRAYIVNGYFSSETVSEKIAELSNRAQGNPKGDKDAQVPAKFDTAFRLDAGKLAIRSLNFNVPGAEAKLHGTYVLDDQTLDFSGTAMLQSTVSEMTTGFKSLLLKAVDPMFKTKNAGTVLPITITGTRDEPKFKVQMKRLGEAKKEAQSN